VRNDEHPAVVVAHQIVEEVVRPTDDVRVALAAGERHLDSLEAGRVDLLERSAVQLAVVALPQPRVAVDRDPGTREGDLGRLDRTAQVGTEHRHDAVVPPSFA
jgi:hypothetical protein